MSRKPRHPPAPDLPPDVLALFAAIKANDESDVLRLLTEGVSPNVDDAHGFKPLHSAASFNRPNLIRLLAEAGGDLDAHCPGTVFVYAPPLKDGSRFVRPPIHISELFTPLHFTIEWDALEAAQELVRLGADINARDAQGQTPLRLAVETSGTYHLVSPRLAKFFIAAGADVNAYDRDGYTIFHEASMAATLSPGHRASQEVIEMLMERKAWMW